MRRHRRLAGPAVLVVCLLMTAGCAHAVSVDAEQMYGLASALTKLSAVVESAVGFKDPSEGLSDAGLVEFATQHDPTLRCHSKDTRSEPFARILMPLCWSARRMEGEPCLKMRAAARPWTSTGGRTIRQRRVSSRWIWPSSVRLAEWNPFARREAVVLQLVGCPFACACECARDKRHPQQPRTAPSMFPPGGFRRRTSLAGRALLLKVGPPCRCGFSTSLAYTSQRKGVATSEVQDLAVVLQQVLQDPNFAEEWDEGNSRHLPDRRGREHS